MNFWGRGVQRFKAWSPEDSESTIIKESDGDIAGMSLLKFDRLVDDSRGEVGRGYDG